VRKLFGHMGSPENRASFFVTKVLQVGNTPIFRACSTEGKIRLQPGIFHKKIVKIVYIKLKSAFDNKLTKIKINNNVIKM
jgi:hypothetical protein